MKTEKHQLKTIVVVSLIRRYHRIIKIEKEFLKIGFRQNGQLKISDQKTIGIDKFQKENTVLLSLRIKK